MITGASSGIGLALVRECAARGAKVVMAARNIEKLSELSRELSANGSECLPVQTDVSREEDCKKLMEQAVQKFGTVHILVNNAAAFSKDTIRTMTAAKIGQEFWPNLFIPMLLP